MPSRPRRCGSLPAQAFFFFRIAAGMPYRWASLLSFSRRAIPFPAAESTFGKQKKTLRKLAQSTVHYSETLLQHVENATLGLAGFPRLNQNF